MSTLQNHAIQNLFPPGITIRDAMKFLDMGTPGLALGVNHLKYFIRRSRTGYKNDFIQTQKPSWGCPALAQQAQD
jgi:hypothetical protein